MRPGSATRSSSSSLDESPTLTVRVWTEDENAAEQLEHELRLRVHERLREHGVFA